MYIFVRRDLSPAQIAVQACHAVYEGAELRKPGYDHPHFVLLAVSNQKQLEQALERVQKQNIGFRPFYEADRDNELTAFCTQPVLESDRSFFRRYQCLNSDSMFSDYCKSENPSVTLV